MYRRHRERRGRVLPVKARLIVPIALRREQSMQRTKSTLIGSRSVRLATVAWLPDQPPKAVTVVSHGYGEHMGRYVHVAEALGRRGYATYTFDHRGHGESAGARAHVERFDYFVDDLRRLMQQAQAEHPALPIFLIGHSMGGLIATRYALRYQDSLAGLVLSAPALQIGDDVPPWVKRVARVLSTVAPRLPVTGATRSPESVLSRDPAVQAAWDADPLCYSGRVRARFGYEFMRAGEDACRRLSDLHIPLLIMHGTDDRLINPAVSHLLYAEASSVDKMLKLWDGCRHELFNELDKADVIAYMLDWMDERLLRVVREPATSTSTSIDA